MGKRALRSDIQGLRAIAVGGVVVNHLFGSALTGGYVGVDVFFVISGFLISTHLFEHPPSRPHDLLAFWGRRVRRLLPASLTVLVVTLLASRWWAPADTWAPTARMARAAGSYWINWLLAHDATDYFNANNVPTPVQHFWSLSVEEQFYAVWPLLLFVLGGVHLLVVRSRGRRAVSSVGLPHLPVIGVMFLLFATSLVASIRMTASDPSAAYFVTWTRAWELAAGGLVAALVLWRGAGVSGWRSTALGWLGLAGIGVAFYEFSSTTAFPGYAALLPVMATAVVIFAKPIGRSWLSPGPWLALPPVQWLGNVSYSLYLWHWPVKVLLPSIVPALGHGRREGAVTVLVSLALAEITRRLIEDPVRNWRPTLPLRYVVTAAVVGTSVVAMGATVQISQVNAEDASATELVAAHLGKPCFGARALDANSRCPRTTRGPLIPPLETVKSADNPAWAPYGSYKNCQTMGDQPYHSCSFGDPKAAFKVMLVGNSHAAMWLPALLQIVHHRPIHLIVVTVSHCPFRAAPMPEDVDWCNQWNRYAWAQIAAQKPDLILASNNVEIMGEPPMWMEHHWTAQVANARQTLAALAATGIPSVVIRNDPSRSHADTGSSTPPVCAGANLNDLLACTIPMSQEETLDPYWQAASDLRDRLVSAVDLTDHICAPTYCDVAVGGVAVMLDRDHLSPVYVETLAPYLERFLDHRGLLPKKR